MITTQSKHFYLRRLHSLAGVFPISLFLLEHMFTNSFILKGAAAYNEKVEFLRSLPFLVPIEILFIGLPILFHALYGMYVTFTAQPNLLRYRYATNWLYHLQRATGIMAFAYIVYHVWATRIASEVYGFEVGYESMQQHMQSPLVFWVYVVGLASVMFHFSNGLWTFAISWGVTIGPRSQRVAGVFCYALGAVVFYAGVASLLHLRS